MRKLFPVFLGLLLALSACSTAPSAPAEKEEDLSSGGSLIESPALWEAIQQGAESSPEIKYARQVSARIEKAFQAEVSRLPAVNQAPGKCYKLPAIDVVMSAEGKITRSANRAKSCWVSGTRTALKVIQNLKAGPPPASLLKDGKFKFSWIPEVPETKPE